MQNLVKHAGSAAKTAAAKAKAHQAGAAKNEADTNNNNNNNKEDTTKKEDSTTTATTATTSDASKPNTTCEIKTEAQRKMFALAENEKDHKKNKVAFLAMDMHDTMEKFSLGRDLLGQFLGNWQTREFTMKGGILTYRKPGEKKAQNMISLPKQDKVRLVTRCTASTHKEAKSDLDFMLVFDDKGTERKLLMRAKDADMKTRWCTALSYGASVLNTEADGAAPKPEEASA